MWKQLGEKKKDLAAVSAAEAFSLQGLELNRSVSCRLQQAGVIASGFSRHEEEVASRATIDRGDGNGAAMNKVDRGNCCMFFGFD